VKGSLDREEKGGSRVSHRENENKEVRERERGL